MKIELPLVIARKPGRLVEAWIPGLDIRETGTSLAALRDELALKVMQRFEREAASELGRFQRAPHQRLRHVDVDTFVRTKEGRKRELKGRLGVLLEKWPADDFWVATPTRLPEARFALRGLEALEQALPRRLATYVRDEDLESLEDYVASVDEKLDLLEVDVYPPTILPRAPAPPPPRPRRGKREQEAPETPAEREARRVRARLGATALREVARNLSHAAEDESLGRAFGRDALVEQVVDELEGREGAAIVLVGPSGVGKSAVVHEVVRRLWLRHHAAGLRRDVWRVDGGRFIAGMKYVGQWEQRARKLVQELTDTGDVLFADDLASLVFAGRTSSSDNNLARYLEPHLARADINILAEATPERLARAREEAPTFAALFRVVRVPPLGELETLRVLLGVLRDAESDTSAGSPPRLEPAALEAVLVAAERFRPHEAFPGKAVRLLARVLGGKADPASTRVGLAQVHAALRLETGLPDFILGAQKRRERAHIQRDLKAMIAGQPEAVEAVTDVILTMQAGLGDPDKPLATLLFVGPTGVGKTETAKALASYLYGSPDRLLRFDMSEFASADSIARLVGSVGGTDGELCAALRAQPFRVILFDEVEKAHPRVFDALLQLLGEGRLSDASGRTANASAAVILLTSNLGVREAAARTGFLATQDNARQHYLSAVRAFFRPEFFNRIDRIVPFAALDRAALRVVVEHALADLLSRRGIQRGNVLVDVAPELLDLLVEQAYDPRYGARPLRRLLERRLTVPLAHHLVTRRGDDRALVELYRKDDDIGMLVSLLADTTPIEGAVPSPAGMVGLRAAVQSLRDELDGLRDSPAFDAKSPWAMELLEERIRIEQQLVELEEQTDDVEFVEEVDAGSQRTLVEFRAAIDRGRTHKGLRPRLGYTEVRHHVEGEAVERHLAGLLTAVRDRMDVLVHRASAAERGRIDRCTLLWECAGLWNEEALYVVSRAMLQQVMGPQLLYEVLENEKWSWQPNLKMDPQTGTSPPARRMAATFEGPGVGELLVPLTGWAVIHVGRAGVSTPILVRIKLIEGIGPRAIMERDVKVALERTIRRRRSSVAWSETGAVVLRRETLRGEAVAVATGGSVLDAWPLAAAFARAARRRNG